MVNLLLQALVDGALLGLVYTAMSVGLSLTMGVMGVINVAHSAFIMLGSFLALVLLQRLHVDPAISFFLAVPIFFAIGAAVQRILISKVERASEMLGLLTLFGVMVVIESVGILVWTTDTRVITVGYTNVHFGVGPVTVAEVRLIAGALSLILIAATHWFMRHTLTGRAIRAMAQNRDAAAALGIDVDRLSMIMFGLGIGTAAAGGVAIGMIFPFAPQTQIQWLAWAFLVVILGGLGGVGRTLAAGLVIGLVQTVAGALLPFNFVYLIIYLLLAIVLVVRGEGLSGVRRRTL